MRKRVVAFALLLVLLLSTMPANSFAAEEGLRIQHESMSSNVIYVVNADGSYASEGWHEVDGYWYYVEAGGKGALGWRQIGGRWYYFNEGDEYSTYFAGRMVTGYQSINGKQYAFKDSGEMYSNGWVDCNHGVWSYAEGSGDLVDGWKKINGKWYYFTGFRKEAATGEIVIGNQLHEFDSSCAWKGQITTQGWRHLQGTRGAYRYDYWLYVDENGNAAVGWKKINGRWYYFLETDNSSRGIMATGVIDINGTKWYFEDSGALREQAGWTERTIEYKMDNGEAYRYTNWFYLNADGSCKTGWFKVGGKWYYAGRNTAQMKTGLQYADGYEAGTVYFLNEDGSLREKAGWAKLNTYSGAEWCYLNADGTCKTGWIKDGGKWYYIGYAVSGYGGVGFGSAGGDEDGVAVNERDYTMMHDATLCNIDGKRYAFDSNGVMRTGWIEENGAKYYYGTDGALYTNGTYTVDGKSCTFDIYGKLQ